MLNFDMSINNPIRLGMEEENFESKFYHVLYNSANSCKDDNPQGVINYFNQNDIDVFNLPNFLYEDLVKTYPLTFAYPMIIA